MIKLFKWLTSTVAGLMLISCVTINIYFPAAAAQKAADRIIGDVWGDQAKPGDKTSPEQAPAKQPDKPADQSMASPSAVNQLAWRTLNWLVTPALAAEPNLNINSPAINKIKAQMKQHFMQLRPYYDNGAVGLTQDGFITLRDPKLVPLKDRNKVNSLVAEVNRDRKALYAEIARANNHPEWQADIQKTFAKRWISNAPAGWWYQQNGSWHKK